jgi:agmatinase
MDEYSRGVVDRLGPRVYISLDLDVLDPGIMAAVGTPEPGGMTWQEINTLLRRVGESRQIVGFDLSELAPEEGPAACSYTAAKLAYKLIAYSAAPGCGGDSL